MQINRLRFRVAALAGAMAALSSIAARADSGPFAGYAGAWSGSGTIATASGSERIRCRAVYAVNGGGSGLQQNLICASDSYRFEVTSNITASANELRGSWSETTRGASGSLSGRAGPGRFNAFVSGAGFSASIAVASGANRQSVTITPQGTDVKNVSMVLHR